MKSLLVAVLIAIVIIFSGIYSTKKLEDMSLCLIEICNQANDEIKAENFKKAEEYVKIMELCVEENYTMFASTIDHNEVDKIDMNIDQMRIYIEERQKADALAYGNVLIGLIEHLPKDHKLRIENIL